ncbi:hypothetical protein ACFX15_012827 [Malus domestica]
MVKAPLVNWIPKLSGCHICPSSGILFNLGKWNPLGLGIRVSASDKSVLGVLRMTNGAISDFSFIAAMVLSLFAGMVAFNIRSTPFCLAVNSFVDVS